MIFFLFRKGKGKGSEAPNLPEWFQYFFFFFFGGDMGLLVSLLLLFYFFFFPVQIPLRYVFNIVSCLIYLTLCTIFSNIEKVIRKNEIKRKCAAV